MDSRVLLVHGDPGILRALEAGVRSEGFEVQTASTGAEGWKIFQATRPGMVVTDVDVGELDGFAFTSRLRQDPIGKMTAVLVVDGSRVAGRRLRAIQAGADSRLVGREPVNEVMTRARLLFGSPNREAAAGTNSAPRGFACELADLDVLDLVALVQRNGRSGIGSLMAPGRVAGSLFFDQGRLIDAQSGHTSGLEAFHRLACWTGGTLNLEWRNFRRRDNLGRSPSELVTSGLEHVEEWTLLLNRLAAPSAVFRVDLDALIDRLSSTFGQLTEVLNACDGVRSVVQIVDECGISALDVLRSLLQLRDEGLISDPGKTARPDRVRQDLEATLMGGGGEAMQLPVAAPLVRRALSPLVPRPDSPGGGTRLTAPLGQAGLPVSVAEAKKLPAVTMQFPSGVPIPGLSLSPTEGAPLSASAQSAPPSADAGQPNQASPAEPRPAQPESPKARLTTRSPLPPRVRPTPPAKDPARDAPQPTTELPAAVQPPAPQPLTPQTAIGVATDAGPPAEEAVSPLTAPPSSEQRGPSLDRRNEKRVPQSAGNVSSDSKWDPVWPQAALLPPERGNDSPTVYLPASTRPAPGQPGPPRALRRPAPPINGNGIREGIRRKSGGGDRRSGRPRKNLVWWQRHRSLLLAVGTSALLGALIAIGVALVRSLR